MATASISLSVSRGDSLQVNATHVISSSDPTVRDISGWSIDVDIRQKLNDYEAIETFAASVTSGLAGTYTFTFTHSLTLDLPNGTYYVSIFRTDTGAQRLMAAGTLLVSGNAKYGASTT